MCLHVKGGSELVTVLTEKQGKGYKGCFSLCTLSSLNTHRLLYVRVQCLAMMLY